MEIVLYILYLLLGAAYINFALDNFSRKRYFFFGLDVMIVVYFAALLIKGVLMW